jgi:hypothetical protein
MDNLTDDTIPQVRMFDVNLYTRSRSKKAPISQQRELSMPEITIHAISKVSIET